MTSPVAESPYSTGTPVELQTSPCLLCARNYSMLSLVRCPASGCPVLSAALRAISLCQRTDFSPQLVGRGETIGGFDNHQHAVLNRVVNCFSRSDNVTATAVPLTGEIS
jgi:hypothetical protein